MNRCSSSLPGLLLLLLLVESPSRARFFPEDFDDDESDDGGLTLVLLESRSPRDLDALFLAAASPISYQSLSILPGSVRARNLPGGERPLQWATSSTATFGCGY